MLDWINDARELAGVPPVALGDNRAAQIHAENAASECFSGHWGTDGLKSGMRYNLAGGYQYTQENVSSYTYCGHRSGRSLEGEIEEAWSGILGSPGHYGTVVNPHHREVNLGIARNSIGLVAIVQQFESDYAAYAEPPRLEGTNLSMSGTVRNGAAFSGDRSLKVDIYYDPPPKALTTGQLSLGYCEDPGLLVTALLPPPPPGYTYEGTLNFFTLSYQRCNSPYDVAEDTLPPASEIESDLRAMQSRLLNPFPFLVAAEFIVASGWQVGDSAFTVKADVSKVLEEHGKGIYTVYVWAEIDGEPAVISQVSLFHGIPRPSGYD